jgi:hypothetical protein
MQNSNYSFVCVTNAVEVKEMHLNAFVVSSKLDALAFRSTYD